MVVVDSQARIENVLSMRDRTPALRHLLLINHPGKESLGQARERAATLGLSVHLMADLAEAAVSSEKREELQPDHEPKPEDNYIVWWEGRGGVTLSIILCSATQAGRLALRRGFC